MPRDPKKQLPDDVVKLLLDAQSFAAAVALGSIDPDVWHMHSIAAASLRDRIHYYRTGQKA